jgi:hypothetical protein
MVDGVVWIALIVAKEKGQGLVSAGLVVEQIMDKPLFLNLGDLPLSRVVEYLDANSLMRSTQTCKQAQDLCNAELRKRDRSIPAESKSRAASFVERYLRYHACHQHVDWLEKKQPDEIEYPRSLPSRYQDLEYFIRLTTSDQDVMWEGFVPKLEQSPLAGHPITPTWVQLYELQKYFIEFATFSIALDTQCVQSSACFASADAGTTTELTVVRCMRLGTGRNGRLLTTPLVSSTVINLRDDASGHYFNSSRVTCKGCVDRSFNQDDHSYLATFMVVDNPEETIRSIIVCGFLDEDE